MGLTFSPEERKKEEEGGREKKIKKEEGASLVVQWLRFHLPTQGLQVQSQVQELRSHIPCGLKTETKSRSNTVKNSIKALKMVHIKKERKRREDREKRKKKG